MRFYFETKKKWQQECSIYVVRNYTGPVGESDEMKNPHEFDADISKLPTDRMWDSDKIWLPTLFSGENFKFAFFHDDTGGVLRWKRVESFDELDEKFFSPVS